MTKQQPSDHVSRDVTPRSPSFVRRPTTSRQVGSGAGIGWSG